MTGYQFSQVSKNFSKYECCKVEFQHYIPSADKYVTGKGILKEIGDDANAGCFIIASGSRRYAIYHERVELTEDVFKHEA